MVSNIADNTGAQNENVAISDELLRLGVIRDLYEKLILKIK